MAPGLCRTSPFRGTVLAREYRLRCALSTIEVEPRVPFPHSDAA